MRSVLDSMPVRPLLVAQRVPSADAGRPRGPTRSLPGMAAPVSLTVQVADWHTAGEPFRIVTEGVPALLGATVLDKRSDAMQRLDDVRAFLCNEPRGHADMYGGFVTEPDDEDGDLGVVFWHKDGFSTACGHGTIALASWALSTGVVPSASPVTELAVDVPSGRLRVTADVDDSGEVGQVRFVNVGSWVSAMDVEVGTTRGQVRCDISYGGAFYASVDVTSVGLDVGADDLPELIALTREIKHALVDHPALVHPDDDRLSGCYGVIWHRDVDHAGPELRQLNVTVFADGEVDRSPCGSGTSARLALLDAAGALPRGEVLLHDGIAGGTFTGRVLGEDPDRGVTTEVGGHAYPTGFATFVLDRRDPLGLGFQLR